MVCNFINTPDSIPGQPEKFPFPFPVPRRAPYDVTTSVSTVHWELQTTHMQCNAQHLHMKCYALKNSVLCSTCISKKRNFHNGMKSTVTTSNTPMMRSVFLNCMKHTRICTYKMKSITTKPCTLRYTYRRNCSSTTKMKLTTTQQDGWPHDKCTPKNWNASSFNFSKQSQRTVK